MANQPGFILKNSYPVIIIMSLICTNCSGPADQPLAVVDGLPIAKTDFTKRYLNFLNTTHVKDNLKYRHILLQSLIDEKLLIKHARLQGLTEKQTYLDRSQAIRNQLLLNKLYAREIKSNLICDDNELRQLFAWSNTKLRARHLFARDIDQINNIYQELLNGASWDSLAAANFNDPVLASNGGDIGFVELGDLDPAFEIAAYNLRDNDISAPVQTSFGYSIIQVIDRETNPFLTEDEYQNQKKWLQAIGKTYKKRPVLREYTDRIADQLELKFADQVVNSLFAALPDLPADIHETGISTSQPIIVAGKPNYKWSVTDAIRLLQVLSPRQQNFISSSENLSRVLEGLIIRQFLIDRAINQGIDKSVSFVNQVKTFEDNLIVREVLKHLSTTDTAGQIEPKDVNRVRYFAFRDSVRTNATISIDSLLVKSLPITGNI